MEFGTVTFFDGRDDKRFGFIEADKDKAKIFFHLNNELMARATFDGSDPVLQKYAFDHDHAVKHGQIPRKGQRVIFERADAPKGPKAARWSNAFFIEQICWPHHGAPHLHSTLLRMTVTWDIVEITFTNRELPKESLFGDMEARIRALMELDGLRSLDEELDTLDYRAGIQKWGDWGEKRTFRFQIFNNTDRQRLIDLTVGRGIVEDVRYDDLTRIRHARQWGLGDDAPLEDIVREHDDYIDSIVD